MNIYIVGIKNKMIPVETWGNCNFTQEKQIELLNKLYSIETVEECIFLTLKDRTEIYISSNSSEFNISNAEEILCNSLGLDISPSKKFIYFYTGLNAVKHLFKIACSLDLLILKGENVLDQIKQAYFIAKENHFIDVILNKLFIEATTIAKKNQTTISVNANTASIFSLTPKFLALQFTNNLKDKNLLIIGSEKSSLIVLNSLLEYSFNNIIVSDQSDAISLEENLSGHKFDVISYADRYAAIDQADIIICSTTNPYYVLTADLFKKSLNSNKSRLILDLSVPSSIDKSISNLENTEIVDIKQIENIAVQSWNIEKLSSIKTNEIIDRYVYDFEKWYDFKNFLPMLKDIQSIADEIIDVKTEEAYPDFDKLAPSDKVSVKSGIKLSVYEIVNTFVQKIRDFEDTENTKNYFSNLTEFLKDR